MGANPHSIRFRRVCKLLPRLAAWALAMAPCATQSSEAEPPARKASGKLKDLPIEVTLKQRTDAWLPQKSKRLHLEIGDVTGGQVDVSLKSKSGKFLLERVSMRPDETRKFKLGKKTYGLRLVKLHNALIGDDFAEFSVYQPLGGSERRKIESLIERVGKLTNAVLLRNGSVHTPIEAAEHLRLKWKLADHRITTAERFIDELASKSTLSGEPYQIKFGTEAPQSLAAYLRKQLKTIGETE